MFQINNHINLIGNVGGAPTSKALPSGSFVTEFSLATSSSYRDGAGEQVKQTEWHNIKAFGKAAEVLEQYVHRGSKLAIVGTLRYSKWTAQDGQKRSRPEIIVESFRLLSPKNQERAEPMATAV